MEDEDGKRRESLFVLGIHVLLNSNQMNFKLENLFEKKQAGIRFSVKLDTSWAIQQSI